MSDAEQTEKIKVGWFTFSCCEDNTVIMTEIMNDHWQEWKQLFDFRHARVLQSKNVMDEFDISFVEGAIVATEHEEKLKDIRSRSKLLVAIGSCACSGMPSSQRNNFDEHQKAKVQFLIDKFKMAENVKKLSDVVTVDYQVPGCPMTPENFLKTVDTAVATLRNPSNES